MPRVVSIWLELLVEKYHVDVNPINISFILYLNCQDSMHRPGRNFDSRSVYVKITPQFPVPTSYLCVKCLTLHITGPGSVRMSCQCTQHTCRCLYHLNQNPRPESMPIWICCGMKYSCIDLSRTPSQSPKLEVI